MSIDTSLAYAQQLDQQDPIAHMREQFHIPTQKDGSEFIYMCGNSLGLMPKRVQEFMDKELKDWASLGVEGHTEGDTPWLPYHEFLTESMARIVGAKPSEVVVMNSLTANLHLMMVSFYRPTPQRRKILMEYSPFPSDRYALRSQIAFHGYNPDTDLIELMPAEGEEIVTLEQIEKVMAAHGEEIALVMLGGVNYYTGQVYPLREVTALGHQYGCTVGFDLAHGAGNIMPDLHDIGADFAVWCTYKYINSGPGSLSGAFVHERHAKNFDLPRFAGWWGHDKDSRFLMQPEFRPMTGAEGWQLSNPPILSMAAIRASLSLFDEVGMPALREKSVKLTSYTADLINNIDSDRISIITPSEIEQRGCQLSIQVKGADKALFDKLTDAGVISDWREPDVIRIAPVPMYNSYEDSWRFAELLGGLL
ncbi:MAG: kynureninase [Bacteroidia bacterium]